MYYITPFRSKWTRVQKFTHCPSSPMLASVPDQNHAAASTKRVLISMAASSNDWHIACRRLSHRHAGYMNMRDSSDYDAAEWFTNGLMPPSPDYTNTVRQSKRSWEAEMMAWRHTLRFLRCLADERVDNMGCRNMDWLGGPEWLLRGPPPADIPWPRRLTGEWPSKILRL